MGEKIPNLNIFSRRLIRLRRKILNKSQIQNHKPQMSAIGFGFWSFEF